MFNFRKAEKFKCTILFKNESTYEIIGSKTDMNHIVISVMNAKSKRQDVMMITKPDGTMGLIDVCDVEVVDVEEI